MKYSLQLGGEIHRQEWWWPFSFNSPRFFHPLGTTSLVPTRDWGQFSFMKWNSTCLRFLRFYEINFISWNFRNTLSVRQINVKYHFLKSGGEDAANIFFFKRKTISFGPEVYWIFQSSLLKGHKYMMDFHKIFAVTRAANIECQ